MAEISKEEWQLIRNLLGEGDVVDVVVIHHEQYGFFVEIKPLAEKEINRFGIVQIPDVSDVNGKPEYPAVGDTIKAVILAFRDSDQVIWLSTKPSVLSDVIS